MSQQGVDGHSELKTGDIGSKTGVDGQDKFGSFGDFIVDTTSAEQVALEGRMLAGKGVADEGENARSSESSDEATRFADGQDFTGESSGPDEGWREADVKNRRTAQRSSTFEREVHPLAPSHTGREKFSPLSPTERGIEGSEALSEPSTTGPSHGEAEPFSNSRHNSDPDPGSNRNYGNPQRQNDAFSQENAHHTAQSDPTRLGTGDRLARENALLRLGVNHRAQREESRAKSIVAQQLVQQHGLARSDYATLLGTSSPKAMVQVAKRIASSNRAARVPAETGDTQLEAGFSVGSGDESEDQRFNRVINKMGRDWTESDLRYMKGGK